MPPDTPQAPKLVPELTQTSEPAQKQKSQALGGPVPPSSGFYIDFWLAQIIQLLGQISSSAEIFRQPTDPDQPAHAITFSDAEKNILELGLLVQAGFEQIEYAVQHVSELSEENLPGIIGAINLFNSLRPKLDLLRQAFIELLDLLAFATFSYCPKCHTLEKGLDFLICEACHNPLVKGNEIREFLIQRYFSQELPLPVEIINALRQRFKGQVNQISFEQDGVQRTRQILSIPGDLHLSPNKTYQFFVIDEIMRITPAVSELATQPVSKSLHKNGSEETSVHLCRNCSVPMQFLRSTVYYETNAELFRCPKCGMEKLTHFKPIWDSGIEDKE